MKELPPPPPAINPESILFVDHCVKKWMPFLKDVGPDRHGRLAYLAEREVSYWQRELKKDGAPVKDVDTGRLLQPIIGSLKELEAGLDPGETKFEAIAESAQAAGRAYYERDKAWAMRNFGPNSDALNEILIPLAERAQSYFIDYERIVSR